MRYLVLLLLLTIPAWAQTPLQLFERTWSLVESAWKGWGSQPIR